jgi:hypothetical protein
MKKFLKILGLFFAVILVILIVTPLFFKKPIENMAKKELNDMLNAKVDFKDFNLSFIRSFPNVYIALQDLTVVGTGDFAKDTLISFKTFSVKVDLISAIKMKNIKVKSILIDHPRVTAIVLRNGKANWNIMKDTTTAPSDTAKSSGSFNFNANLKKFEVVSAYIKYQDDTAKMSAEIKDLNFLLSGNFSAKTTDMEITSSIESLDFIMDGIKYLKKAKVGFASKVGADLEKSIYTIQDNEIKLNELSMVLEGSVKMPKEAIDIDLKFKTAKADFKTLLSLVPAVYMKDFPSVQTSGNLKLDGYVKGIYEGKKLPNVGLNLMVEKAMFRYPALPKSVENIQLDMKLFFDGVQNDNSTVDINKFHVELAGNPFDVNLHISTPISDMKVVGNFTGKIDFSSIADVVPMDSLTLKGVMESNVDIMGQMSSITKGKYEDFKADGTLKLENFEFASPVFPQGVKIVAATMAFSPKYVELTTFDSRVGKSDFKLNGKLEKFIPYVFNKDTIKGSLNFASNLIDVNELMGPPVPENKKIPNDTTPLTLFEVPGNIDFLLNTKIDQINYDKLKINDAVGSIIIKNSRAVLKNVGMNLLEGSMTMNGEYNTRDIKNPFFDFAFNMKDIDIPSAYTAFNTVQKLAPVAQNCKGRISADLNLYSYLDKHMMPVYKSMAGKGKLMSKNIEIGNSNTFIKIADALKNDKFRKLSLTDLNISFEIKNGRVYVSPFETKFGNSKMTIGGDQGLDQTLNYIINMAIPRAEFGGAANTVLNNLTAKAASNGLNIQPGENVNVGVLVSGTFLKPEIKLNLKDNAKNAAQDIKDQMKNQAAQKVQEVKEDVTAKAKVQADKLVKDAEAEAQKIRDGAKSAADQLRKESNDAADKVVSEAKNPLLKVAAQKTAEKMRKEGEAKAKKLEDEGNLKADALVNKAKEEAGKIK